MNNVPPADRPLPEGVVPDDAKILLELLFHVENLQHSRIYFFLVAETIFFLAAATAYQKPGLVFVLSLAGILTALLFTMVNLKHQWRVWWLSRKLESACPTFRRYVNFHSFEKLVALRGLNEILSMEIIVDETTSPMMQETSTGPTIPPILASTGFLFTWGLFIIIVSTWFAFLTYGIFGMLCFP